MSKLLDPPSGWRYGFPKEITDKELKNVNKFLIDNGYPENTINEYGEFFTYRIIDNEKI